MLLHGLQSWGLRHALTAGNCVLVPRSHAPLNKPDGACPLVACSCTKLRPVVPDGLGCEATLCPFWRLLRDTHTLGCVCVPINCLLLKLSRLSSKKNEETPPDHQLTQKKRIAHQNQRNKTL